MLLALLTAVSAVVGIECTLDWLLPEAQFSRMMTVRTRELVALPRVRVQIFGDSVTDGALNDKVLAAASGLSVNQLRNASIPSSSAYFAAPLLERQLAAGNAPDILILGYNARSYAVPMVPKFLAHMATAGEAMVMLRQDRPRVEDALLGLVQRGSFSHRYRPELNSWLRYGSGHEVFDPKLSPATGIEERRQQLPTNLNEVEARPKGQVVEFAPGFSNDRFVVQPEMRRSLERFFDLAAGAGIEVWVVSMPKPPAAHALHESNGFNTAYEALLGEFAPRPGVRVLLREQQTLPATSFIDAVHLTRPAAMEFSQRVGVLLRAVIVDSK